MKSLLFLTAATVCATLAADIPEGTHLLLRMEHSISSRTAKPGDGVHMRTVTPLNAGGKVLLSPGSYVQGAVANAQPATRGHGDGKLEIRLEELILQNGEALPVSARSSSFSDDTYRASKQPSSGPFALAAILAGAAAGGATGGRIGLGAAAGALVVPSIFGRGKEIELRQGTTLDVRFDQPLRLPD